MLPPEKGTVVYIHPEGRFFTLRFDSFKSALGTLLGTDDMLDATKNGRIVMDGGPEFGAQFGGFLLTVGSYVQ